MNNKRLTTIMSFRAQRSEVEESFAVKCFVDTLVIEPLNKRDFSPDFIGIRAKGVPLGK